MSGRPAKSLKAAADAAEGAESARSTAGFDTHKATLTEDPHCVGPVIDALWSFGRKNRGHSEIIAAIRYVRSHRQRMHDQAARDEGVPAARVFSLSGPHGPTDGDIPMPISRPTTIARPAPGSPDSPDATDQESTPVQTPPEGNHAPCRSRLDNPCPLI